MFEFGEEEVLSNLKKVSFRGLEEGPGAWRWTINGMHGVELVRVNSPFRKLKNAEEVMLCELHVQNLTGSFHSLYLG